jgi:hypothetical protein
MGGGRPYIHCKFSITLPLFFAFKPYFAAWWNASFLKSSYLEIWSNMEYGQDDRKIKDVHLWI